LVTATFEEGHAMSKVASRHSVVLPDSPSHPDSEQYVLQPKLRERKLTSYGQVNTRKQLGSGKQVLIV